MLHTKISMESSLDQGKIVIKSRRFAFKIRHGINFSDVLIPLVISLSAGGILSALVFFFLVSDLAISSFLGISLFVSTFAFIRSETFNDYSVNIQTVISTAFYFIIATFIPCYIINDLFGLLWAIIAGAVIYTGLIYDTLLID